ncbi:MAG: dihydroorotase [Pseudomonadales bacterium]|jgi:dihydroorotase|nr:dihydroorotase [Pseudomonadales bacterium]
MQSITLKRPDDWHIHLRDDTYLERTVQDAARYFGRVLVMPNLVPPVTDVNLARAYRDRILGHAPDGFTPVMALYLTDQTSADTVVAASQSGFCPAFKLYPAGATTNSAFGVNAIEAMFPVFEAMQEHDVILSIHGEVTDEGIDIFDREAAFIDTMLTKIVHEFPALRVILEHITTREAAQFVAEASDKVAATITAHHLLFNRNDMLVGGMKPIHYCLPILKRDIHQKALVHAAVSGNRSFFLGTDSAPHPRHAKENACGCAAGCYTAHAAIELYAEVFEAENALQRLEGFASEYGADFYGYPHNTDTIQLDKDAWHVEEKLAFGTDELIPTRGGESVAWRVTSGARPLKKV